MLGEVDRLVKLLHGGKPVELGAIEWASPVVSFGDPIRSSIATLGLNPSNLEFVGRDGTQLLAPHHRFESLATLKARNWDQLAQREIQKVWLACENYFHGNPYDGWFKRLDRILVDTGASYYTRLGPQACHLDLVPFATSRKWSELRRTEQAELVYLGTPSLVRTIMASEIRVLVLNGSAVVREFCRLVPDSPLKGRAKPTWALQGGRVNGVSFAGHVNQLGGHRLDRELLVLGYNHNIQSSFGVTTEVVARIASWIGRNAAEMLR